MNEIKILIASCISSLLIYIFLSAYFRKRKIRTELFSNKHSKAIVCLYSINTKIDNIDIKNLNYVRGKNGQIIVALREGKHKFEGRFFKKSIESGRKVEYISKKAHYNFEFEHGYTYSFDMYFGDIEKTSANKIAEYKLYVEMERDMPSSIALVICHKEKCLP